MGNVDEAEKVAEKHETPKEMTQDEINKLNHHDDNLIDKVNFIDFKVKVPNMIKKLFNCDKCK